VLVAAGTDHGNGAIGAGDQGMMFGYASDETETLMPLPIWLAHQLIRRLDTVRTSGQLPLLRPDAKSQVTVRYQEGGRAVVDTVVLSTQHAPGLDLAELREAITDDVILPVIGEELRSPSFRTLINPAGAFEIGGPKGDTGLTGRKIIVDTYGGACPHGGGAFSGKDATKVDRSGAYVARWLAKHVVAAGIAPRCTVQLAYAIGVTEPVSVAVDLYGHPGVDPDAVARALTTLFDLTPAGIIRELELDRPIFTPTAAFGHFGRDEPGFTWERTPRITALLAALG
jgi:S-adenosylmethionine synthetase